MAIKKRLATRRDVAALAGVSGQTVSNVVNGQGSFSDAVRDKVLAAVEATGYVPNNAARSLVTRRSGNVAVLFESLNHPYNAAIVSSICRYLAEASLGSLLIETQRLDARRLRELTSGMIDAVVIAGGNNVTDILARQFVEQGLPIVVEGYEGSFRDTVAIVLDIDSGVGCVVRHLAQLGHKHVAYVGDCADAFAGRRLSFIKWRNNLGLVDLDSLIVATPTSDAWGFMGGHSATESLLASGVLFTAIFGANDSVAIGAMRALADAGISVPNDVSVVGWDDIGVAKYTNPALSTVKVDVDAVGRRIVDVIVAKLEGQDVHSEHILGVELVVRASTGPVKR